MPERALSKIQYGKETTRGTAVAATKQLLCAPMPVNPDRVPFYPTDLAGIRARSTRSRVDEYLVRNTIRFDADHPLYYQALPLLFSLGLKGDITAAEATAGQSDYLWTFTPSLTAANAPDTITLEVGDDVQAYETAYLMLERLRIGGQVSQDGQASPVTCEADFFARQWSTASFTGSISIPAVEEMNSKLTKFYLDTTWAGVGGTEKTATLRAWEVEIMTGYHPKFMGGANKYFDLHAEGYIDVMVTLTLEGNATADAIWDAMNTQALQVLRLSTSGSAIGTGTAYNLTLDVGGTWASVVPMGGESNGNNLHTAILHGKYDGTGAKLLDCLVTTNANTI